MSLTDVLPTREQVSIYRLGFRLKQALILTDRAARLHQGIDLVCCQKVLRKLDLAFPSFASAVDASGQLGKAGCALIFHTYQEGKKWFSQPPNKRPGTNPAQECLQLLFQLVVDSLSKCADVPHAEQSFDVGVNITWAVESEGPHPYPKPGWEVGTGIAERVGQLGVQVGQFVVPQSTRAAVSSYPTGWQGWDDLERGLHLLEDRSGCAPAADGDSRIPRIQDEYRSDKSNESIQPVNGHERPPAQSLAPSLPDSQQEHACYHSLDFRSVKWFGKKYTFSPAQAKIVKMLWEAWEDGLLDVSYRSMKEKHDLDSSRMSDHFRGHEAWMQMIVSTEKAKGCSGKGKGCYRLQDPNELEAQKPTSATGSRMKSQDQAEELVTLNQMAAIIARPESWLEQRVDQLPPPKKEKSSDGQPAEWEWAAVRACLEKMTGRSVPEAFPAHRSAH